MTEQSLHFVAARSSHRKLEGGIQKAFQRALAAVASHGDRVINATIGMAFDENGKLFTSGAYMDELRAVSPEAACAYSPIAGIPDFLHGTCRLFVDWDSQPAESDFPLYRVGGNGALACPIATVGGSSALSLAIGNFTERGSAFLTADYYWEPYLTIAGARDLSMRHFTLFDSAGRFNAQSFAAQLRAMEGASALVLLNDPAHNPTGYCMTDADWESACAILEEEASRRSVILLLDIAYLGFRTSFDEDRRFIRRLLDRDWPARFLMMIAGSCSKAFLAYGSRLGTCIAIHRDPAVLREFFDCIEYSIRGEYSNIPRGPMQAVANICKSDEKIHRHMSDIDRVRGALQERGALWKQHTAGTGLETIPHEAGYFLVVRCDEPQKVSSLLDEELIFTVPIQQGVRVATCAVPARKIPALAAAMAAAVRRVG